MKFLIPLSIPSAMCIGIFFLIPRKTSIPEISKTFRAKISFVTLAAAISPVISGSSKIGVKMSIFFTKTRLVLGTGITAESSASPFKPASDKSLSNFSFESLQFQPKSLVWSVNR